MIDPKLMANIQAVVNMLRQTVSDWETVVRGVEDFSQEHEKLRVRCGELERERETCQAEHGRLREQRDEAIRVAAELRAAHDNLCAEHEATARALADLRVQYDSALRDRRSAADELAGILRRLRGPGAETGAPT